MSNHHDPAHAHQTELAKHDTVEGRAEASLRQFVANAKATAIGDLPAVLAHFEAHIPDIAKGIAHGNPTERRSS